MGSGFAAAAFAALLLCICCCCCCCCCPVLPPAAFAAAAVVAALPTSCSCSGCCPSCAHHPMFLLKGILCSETQTLVPPALFSSKQRNQREQQTKEAKRAATKEAKRQSARREPLWLESLRLFVQSAVQWFLLDDGGCLLAGDLIVSSADARSGVGLLRRTADEHGPFCRGLGGLQQHGIGRCCLLFWSASSFGTGIPRMSSSFFGS